MSTKNIIFTCAIILLSLTSCLKSGLDRVENSDLKEITGISFEYRWIAKNANGYDVLCKQALTLSNNKATNTTADSVFTKLTVPAASTSTAFSAFNAGIRQNVGRDSLYLIANLSPAAKIEPIEGAPVLGLPGDFSGDSYRYKVTAANGTTKIYTIVITDFVK